MMEWHVELLFGPSHRHVDLAGRRYLGCGMETVAADIDVLKFS